MKTLGWCFAGTLVVLAVIAYLVWPAGMRPFPFPLSREIQQYIVQQGYVGCEGGEVVISFLEKDGQRYVLAATALDDTGHSQWVLIQLEQGTTPMYVWHGTATSGEHAEVTGGHPLKGDTLDPCSLIKPPKTKV